MSYFIIVLHQQSSIKIQWNNSDCSFCYEKNQRNALKIDPTNFNIQQTNLHFK